MTLADKIIQLRKQHNWSQEDLAEHMDVSRQSVSKWESGNSVPDLNKVVMLSKLFKVSTDYLLTDSTDAINSSGNEGQPSVAQISAESAMNYVKNTQEVSRLTLKGVVLCVCSVVPLFLLMALADSNTFGLTNNMATVGGIIGILLMVLAGVSFFLKINQYDQAIESFENKPFELAYGVRSLFTEKLDTYRPTYNRRILFGIFMFIFSFVPVMVTSVFSLFSGNVLVMIGLLVIMIAIGLCSVIPASAQYDAYYFLLEKDATEGFEAEKSSQVKNAEKIAKVYWPLLTAVYLGWSLLTMDWQNTWVVWPVGAVLFVAIVGLVEFFTKEE